METYTVVTVAMSPDDLFALIISAMRACWHEMPSAPVYKGRYSGSHHRKMLSSKDIEKEFGITSRMLMSWRQMGIGPAYVNLGKKVFYKRATFEKFVDDGEVQTTGFVDQ